VLPPAELVIANIALEAVEALGPKVDARRLVTSGYLQSDEPRFPERRRVARRRSEGWAADLFERI
jgi:hypothetical protein